MKNKGAPLLALIPAGLLAVLLFALNIVVYVQGQVSLHQPAEQGTAETEADGTGQEDDVGVSADFESFRIARAKGAADERGKSQQDGEENYLCAESIVRVLTMEDVERIKNGSYSDLPAGKDILQMVVNEIYARNGYQFENEDIQSYFASKRWYQADDANARDMDAIYQKMSEIDKANIDFLREVR